MSRSRTKTKIKIGRKVVEHSSEKKQQSGFATCSDTNQAVQPKKIARSFKLQI